MKKQWISAILMTIIGGGIYAASASYKPQPVSVLIPETENTRETTALASDSPGTKEPPSAAAKEDEEDIFRPSAEELNLTHFFPEGADPGDISQSYAGKAFQELVIQDEEWMNGIYIYADMTPEQFAARTGEPRSRVMGSYNPKDDQHDPDNPDTWAIHSFRNIRTNVTNGDGSPISAYSNVIEIMSLANVYTFYKDTGNYDLFLSYAKSLWERSHSYSVGMSDVYYCEGCLSEEDERARLEREAAAEEEAVKAVMAGADNGPDRESGAEGAQEDTTAESKARVITASGSKQTSEENATSGTDNNTTSDSSLVLVAEENGEAFPNDVPETSPSGTEEHIPQESSTGNEIQGTGLPENPPAITGRDNPTEDARTTGEDLSAGEVSPSGTSGVSLAEAETSDAAGASAAEKQSSDISMSFPAEGPSANSSASFPAEGEPADSSASFPAEGESADSSVSSPAEEPSADSSASFPAEEPSANISGASSAEKQVSDTSGTAQTDQPAQPGQGRCPGHVDLLVQMKIRGLKEENGLFKADRLGNAEENYEENGWQGWTETAMKSARSLAGQDWYQRYGITVSSISMRNPLTSYEIEEYMERLPEGLSQTRKDIIRFALSSVGKIPYYWGGKPSAPNYARNGFGTLVSPDEKGRILRGLDCSGWINWVYWSVTGNRLPHESTSGLALCGSPVSRDHLQPGDIVIRTGEDAHVVMFLEWTEDGSIRCIHESSANINNVTVGIRDANWPYYRKLID